MASTRATNLQHGRKRQEIVSLRQRKDRIEMILGDDDDESPLFNPSAVKRQIQQIQKPGPELPPKEFVDDNDFFLPQSNRIYHDKTASRQMQGLRGSNLTKGPRASLNNLCKQEEEVLVEKHQERPQSSQGNKFKGKAEKGKESAVCDNRPGSSKSSRLFKMKGPFANDTINSDNEEGKPLIRVISIGAERAATTYLKGSPNAAGRNRGGTSLTQHQRGVVKMPPKIDPDFYRLFAK